MKSVVESSSSEGPKNIRRAAYDYTECLAHAEVTYKILQDSNIVVCRVIGYLTHNDACRVAKLARISSIPLHEHVVQVAVQQLCNGARYIQEIVASTAHLVLTMKFIVVDSINTIQKTNLDMFAAFAYRGQHPGDVGTPVAINHRYHILPSEFSRLYRQHYRKAYDIDVGVPPEHNVDNWLNPPSPRFKPTIYQALFH